MAPGGTALAGGVTRSPGQVGRIAPVIGSGGPSPGCGLGGGVPGAGWPGAGNGGAGAQPG